MNNYRKISFDIDFAGKKVLNTIQMPLEELTQNDFNSSLLTLKLMQGQELINLQGLSVVLNFLMPSGKDYVDTINAEMIDIENSIVSYSIPKDILSEVGMVVGTVSLYKEGYRYTSIVQFKFEVVSDFVEDGEIVESDNYPILAQMIGEVQNLKDEEMKRVESEIERIENEEERESSELQREMNEVERHEAENVRIINEQNREVKELERDQAERLREANSAKVKREEETRLEAETLRVQAESLRVGAESDRIQAESIRQMQESDRHEKELERQAAENLRVLAEIEREQKQNEFNTRAEEVAVRIEEESQRISDLVEIEESKLVKPNDMVDYMGNQHNSLKAKSDSDVDYAVKTAIGEFNYLDYEGQHITATNSIEGHAKSAILCGKTLVNLASEKTKTFTTSHFLRCKLSHELTNGKKYLFKWNITDNTIGTFSVRFLRTTDGARSGAFYTDSPQVVTVTNDGYDALEFFTNASAISQGLTATINDITVIEYQEGMENWDIPYFEGMQSVRMPVLKTVGKNLFDGQLESGRYTQSEGTPFGDNTTVRTVNKIKVKPSTVYTLKTNDETTLYNSSEYCNGVYIGHKIGGNPVVFTTSPTTNELHLSFKTPNTQLQFQLEEGSTETSYEPYKSNILTTNEEVVLGAVGTVVDTLDLLTGEIVKKTKEVVLNGSENEWSTYWNDVVVPLDNFFTCKIFLDGKIRGDAVTDKFLKIELRSEQEGFISDSGGDEEFAIRISKNKLETQDLQGFKKYLSQNPITVRYQLATPTIKTVDLSDNVVYSYNGTTHYSCNLYKQLRL